MNEGINWEARLWKADAKRNAEMAGNWKERYEVLNQAIADLMGTVVATENILAGDRVRFKDGMVELAKASDD